VGMTNQGVIVQALLDGLTGEGIFGDLQIPEAPTRIFKPEPTVFYLLEQLEQLFHEAFLTPREAAVIKEVLNRETTRLSSIPPFQGGTEETHAVS
jgi:hypothetical protein